MEEPEGDVIVQDSAGLIWTKVEPGAWESHDAKGTRRFDSWTDLVDKHGPVKVYHLHD